MPKLPSTFAAELRYGVVFSTASRAYPSCEISPALWTKLEGGANQRRAGWTFLIRHSDSGYGDSRRRFDITSTSNWFARSPLQETNRKSCSSTVFVTRIQLIAMPFL